MQPIENARYGKDTPSSPIDKWPFGELRRGYYGAILADPPWHFKAWSEFKQLADGSMSRACERYYDTMDVSAICSLPVASLAANDAALFIWITWPTLTEALEVIKAWGFGYKTCAFAWMKADNTQPDLFVEEISPFVGMGYWTRANSEVCLLATRGTPKRLNADVRQGIIAPRRQHSRKPEGIHQRIERLVIGPYCELFARQRRAGWDCWGNQTDKFAEAAQ